MIKDTIEEAWTSDPSKRPDINKVCNLETYKEFNECFKCI